MFRPLRTSQLVVDVVLAGVFALVVTPLELRLGGAVEFNTLATVLVAVLMAGALAVRRLSPGLALAGAWAAALVQMGFGRGPSLVDLAIFAVLYATAAYGSRLVFWLGFASAIVGAGVITLYVFGRAFTLGGMSLSSVTTALAVLVAALFALLLSWTVGALVRTSLRARESRAAKERAEADAVAEQERLRIARDMHDVVAHSLAVIIAQADGARYAMAAAGATAGGSPEPDAAASAALETISSTARGALADVRLLLTQLRHPHSLLPASSSPPWGASGERGSSEGDGPQPTLADLEALYAHVRAAGVQLRVDVDPAPPSSPPGAAQLAVYRILQEALTNALRHGAGAPVSVRLRWLADRVELEVRNALGAQPGAAGGGHGVIGMRERAQLAGGRLDAGAEAGEFVVRAAIPIEGAGR